MGVDMEIQETNVAKFQATLDQLMSGEEDIENDIQGVAVNVPTPRKEVVDLPAEAADIQEVEETKVVPSPIVEIEATKVVEKLKAKKKSPQKRESWEVAPAE